jgi:uncharacterized membrane protein
MSTWRYLQQGQPSGPVETSELQSLFRNGTLPPDTLVQKDGAADWVRAGTQPELADPASGTSTLPPPGASVPPVESAPPPGAVPVPDAADVEKNKIFAVLAYIGLLFLVPLLAAPQSRFARYHTNQGVVLFLASIIAWGCLLLLAFIPFVGCLAMPLMFVVGVGSLVLMIMGIINAASGQYKPLPLIGNYQLIK